jgi:Tol biopolymer transport system component
VSVTAPPRPQRPSDPIDREELEALVEALIEEARQRQRRRRRIYMAVAAAAALVAVVVVTVFERAVQSENTAALAARWALPGGSTGSKIAFISAPHPHVGRGGVLYVINPDGSGQREVMRNVGRGVAWSPDGQLIVFSRDSSGIYVVNADGRAERRLTRSAFAPAWSPDGRMIAFTRSRNRWRISEVYVMSADGSGQRKLTSARHDGSVAWLPDGRIAFVRSAGKRRPPNFELYVMNADGSRQRNLTREWGLDGRHYANYLWSAEGRKIAFTSNGGLYVMNADGSRQRRLTRTGRPGWIAWSPDGRKIAFVRERQRQIHGLYHSEIYVINVDGSGQRRLTQRGAKPRWSPDGEKIAFTSSRDGHNELYVMNADGSGQRRLTHVTQDGAWVNYDFAWAPAQK